MKILFAARAGSIHTARWIRQFSDLGWDAHLFCATAEFPHPEMRDVTVYHPSFARPRAVHPSIRMRGFSPLTIGNERLGRHVINGKWLARVVKWVKPDIVHAMETQHAGYVAADAKRLLGDEFPPLLLGAWGNDLHLFGKLAYHAPKVRATLDACDYFVADCARDIRLAVDKFGFTGDTFPPLPVAGGFDMAAIREMRSETPPSLRKVIVLKGYQHWAGRALDGLRAIELCSDVLGGYKVIVNLASPDTITAAELMSARTGIPVEIMPTVSHDVAVRMHSQARVSMGISISDGLPLAALEAALMGSFPVQSETSSLGEKLCNGRGTLLVPAEDVDAIATALRRAVTDDALVDEAAVYNFRRIEENMSFERVRSAAVEMYDTILSRAG